MVAVAKYRCPRIASASGFTLIEILIVMLIVGIMATALLTNLSITPNRQLQQEAERLAWLLRENALQARASGMTIIWRAIPAGYEFTLDASAKPSATDVTQEQAKPRTYQLPSGIQVLKLHTNNEPATALIFSGRQISGPSTITLGNQEETIEVVSPGLDRFTAAQARTRSTHVTH